MSWEEEGEGCDPEAGQTRFSARLSGGVNVVGMVLPYWRWARSQVLGGGDCGRGARPTFLRREV